MSSAPPPSQALRRRSLAPSTAARPSLGRARVRRFSLALLLATAPGAALAVGGCSQRDAGASTPGPGGAAPTVSVVRVQPETLPVSNEWIATLDGYVNAQIRPQVTGYLVRRTYEEGAAVRKDQVLFEIDPRPFRAALAQAEAALAKAEADLGRAERDRARDTPLAKERAIPQSQLDNDVQAELAARAAVKAAEARIDAAKLNLGFTKVRSLIDGVAAIATAQIGDLVNPSTLLTTVSQVDPIRVNFSISEQEYLRHARQLNQPTNRELWHAGSALELFLADGSKYDQPGRFLAADRQLDPRTGTIRISATFPNPDQILRPGMYGRVRAETAIVEGALLVPQRAVAEMQGTAQVRVVGADNQVSLRNVQLGARAGNRWVVEKGVEAGEQVIVDGPPLRDGARVTPTLLAASARNAPERGAGEPGAATPGAKPPGLTTPTAGSPGPQPSPRGE